MTARTKPSPTEKCPKQLKRQCSSCSPKFKIETLRLHSGIACDRPETTEIPKVPPIPEVVWRQPSETSTNQCTLNNTNKNSTIYYTQETSKTIVASQTTPLKGTQPENYVLATEQPPGNQTGNEPVPFLSCSKNCLTDIQNSEQHVPIIITVNTTIPPLTITTPLIEEGLVRDEHAKEVYFPLTSTVVLKRKQELLYLPLDFENNRTVGALVETGAFVSAIAQKDFDTIKGKAPNKILKFDDPPNFQIQVANGQLEKPLATATLKF